MTLVPGHLQGRIYQHDIIMDLIEDLGGISSRSTSSRPKSCSSAFVPKDDIELIRTLQKPLFGEVTGLALSGTEIAIVS